MASSNTIFNANAHESCKYGAAVELAMVRFSNYDNFVDKFMASWWRFGRPMPILSQIFDLVNSIDRLAPKDVCSGSSLVTIFVHY